METNIVSQVHQLELDNLKKKIWSCSVCGWTWQKGQSFGAGGEKLCLAVKQYQWFDDPDLSPNLKTQTQLKEVGFNPGGPPVGVIYWQRKRATYWLFDQSSATPRPKATVAQLAALEKAHLAQRTCKRCGEVRSYVLAAGEICEACEWQAHQEMLDADRAEASDWARKRLDHPTTWAVLDTETTGLGIGYDRIVQIAVVVATPDDRPDEVLFSSLINPQMPIPAGVVALHGITDEMVKTAPTFAQVYPSLKEALGRRRILAYNAEFDYSMLLSEYVRVGLPELSNKWEDVMEPYSQWTGDWSNYHKSYRWQSLGSSHDAVNDCRAVLSVLREMAATQDHTVREFSDQKLGRPDGSQNWGK